MRRALLALIVCAMPAAASAESLHLVCLGAGSANRPSTTYGSVADNHGNAAWGQIVGQRTVPFDDQVNIEITDGERDGRIRLPRAMLPPIHGGDGGWFKLKNIRWSNSEITGSAGVNFINSPKVHIDRLSGHISISGKAGDYTGECQAYNPDTAARRF